MAASRLSRLRLGWDLTQHGPSRSTWQRVVSLPPGDVTGLVARQWLLRSKTLDGCYLFEDEPQAIASFLEAPGADPAYALVAAADSAALGRPHLPLIDTVARSESPSRPVFIISPPRSGSTWLFDLLSHAPGLWTQGQEGQGAIDGVGRLHASAREWHSDRLTADDVGDPIDLAVHAGWRFGLRDRDGRGDAPVDARWLDKTTENVLRVDFLARVCPDAQFVFLHRDARQTISSLIKAWRHGGFVRFADLPGWPDGPWCFLLPPDWRALRGHTLQHVATGQWESAIHWALHDLEMLDHSRWTSVDYHELVAHPRLVVERLCAFLGIDIDASFAAFLANPETVRVTSATAVDPPSVVKWRSHAELDARQVEQVTRRLSARLRNLDEPPAEPSDATASRRRPGHTRFLCPLPDADETSLAKEWVVDPTLRVQVGASIPLGLAATTRFRERFAPGQPILWSRDRLTNAWRPFWASRGLVPQLVELETMGPLAEPSGRLPAALMAAGLAATADEWTQRASRAEAIRSKARSDFSAAGFCVVPDVLGQAHVQALARYYRDLVAEGQWALGDPQVARRHGWHNESVGRFFHHQLAQFVGDLVGSRVCPSYCYVSAYRQGAELAPHIDRKQCEFTMSIVFDEVGGKSSEWPLWFLAGPQPSSASLEPGEGVLFLGHDLPHWRDMPPTGSLALSTLLLHYVSADFAETLD